MSTAHTRESAASRRPTTDAPNDAAVIGALLRCRIDKDDRWLAEASSDAAAYGDRDRVASDLPVGGGAISEAQTIDPHRALQAA